MIALDLAKGSQQLTIISNVVYKLISLIHDKNRAIFD
jgi:hypothetical protein